VCARSAARASGARSPRTHSASRRLCHATVHARPPKRRRKAPANPKTRGRATLLPTAVKPTVGESHAATIAAVLATPCQNTELAPEAGNLPLIQAAVLCLINTERAQNGDAPLVRNRQLEEAAEGHSQELIAADYFGHVSPGGLTPVDRIRTTGYIPSPQDGYVIGENLAWGTFTLATPQAIVSAWLASPEHLANILEAQYSETGIGVVPAVPASLADGAPGATYAQEFGVIIR
jgi:uncharacterized protein YkwD